VEGTSRPELFEWCLAHGASTDLPTTQNDERRPILERAASMGDTTTFEPLRQKGALLSTRMLPLAVRSANDLVPMTDQPPSETYEATLNIVGHLIDNLGVDVNNDSCWACNTCSTPLCCIDCYTKNDATQLIWLLFDKGGDPYVPGSSGDTLMILGALQAATMRQNTVFLSARSRHGRCAMVAVNNRRPQ
jgi:hypothetical protein